MPPRGPAPPLQSVLTPERMRQGIPRVQRRIAEVQAFDPASIRNEDDTSKADVLAASVESALAQTFGQDTPEYQRYSGAANLAGLLILVIEPLSAKFKIAYDVAALCRLICSIRHCRSLRKS
jgi:hypothetical protein